MDYLMIIIAVAIAWAFAFIWYHPKVLGTKRAEGVPKELQGAPGLVSTCLSLAQFLAIGYIAHRATQIGDIHDFWCIMLPVAIAFFLGICAGGHMEGKARKDYLIDAGFVSLAVIIISAIIQYS